MTNISISLPDGKTKTINPGIKLDTVVKECFGTQGDDILAYKVNGVSVDLDYTINEDSTIEFLKFDDEEGKRIFRHSAGHILAQAVQTLFPDAKITMGGWVDDRYYYDFEMPRPFTPDDFKQIERGMKKIIGQKQLFAQKNLSRQETRDLFTKLDEPYKLEIIEGLKEDENITVYWNDSHWVDLCRGPHVPNTSFIKAIKILATSSCYWRGQESGKTLQRLYLTAFPEKEQLADHLNNLLEIQKRDHRILGPELSLFKIDDNVGPGLVLWLPNGAIIREIIEGFIKSQLKLRGYQLVYTPHVARASLWETSGHMSWYRENMFAGIDVEGQEYIVKPMNCPFHVMVYQSTMRSYRDLPLRIGELGTVYRYERSGVLHGLLRVRGLTQDDAHIFCTTDQVEKEVANLLDLTYFLLGKFGFNEYEVVLSLRSSSNHDDYAGTSEIWERAEAALETMLKQQKIEYQRMEGEAAFYGPKIDVFVSDALGRKWQCTTIQLDFNLPERFNLNYVGSDGDQQRPVMIHRAILGSIERFFGILIEHYAGAFPVWLAPTQVSIVPIADRHHSYAKKVQKYLEEKELRVETLQREGTMNSKVRDAEKRKVPYILVVGDREENDGNVSVRQRGRKNLGTKNIPEFLEIILPETKC